MNSISKGISIIINSLSINSKIVEPNIYDSRVIQKEKLYSYIEYILKESNLNYLSQDYVDTNNLEELINHIYKKSGGNPANIYYLLEEDESNNKIDNSFIKYETVKKGNNITKIIINNNIILLFYFSYILICIVSFFNKLFSIYNEYFIWSLSIAKASAMVLNISMFYILFPIILNKHIHINSHIVIGINILIFSIIHTICHLIYGKYIYKDFAAISGWIMLLLMLMAYPLYYKSKNFNIFYYSHIILLYTFIIFYILHPVFTRYFGFPTTWLYIIIPLIIYIYNRHLRLHPRKAILLNYKVYQYGRSVKLVFDQVFRYQVGQYLYINIPEISIVEYHPFSIISSPRDSTISILIKNNGDWTNKLINNIRDIVTINVDGPRDSNLQKIINFKYVLIIATGIGITPFISFIKKNSINTKIFIIYICRDQYLYKYLPYNENIKYYIYYTGIKDSNNIIRVRNLQKISYNYNNKDIISGFPFLSHLSYPDWEYLFQTIESKCDLDQDLELDMPVIYYKNTKKIGVFYCGSNYVKKIVKDKLKKNNSFLFFSENI